MTLVQDLLQAKRKPKEKTLLIEEAIQANPSDLADLFAALKTAPDPQKGIVADVIEELSKTDPDSLLPYLDILIAHITYKAPHVTWGMQEAIGNIAQKYPKEASAALPQLQRNTTHESTVVRWCAAYAISEITKHDADRQQELISLMTRLAKKEQNNGVRNVYLKALKTLRHPPA